jgi:hypothetical protein
VTAGQDWLDQARRLVETFRAGTGEPAGASADAPADGLTGDCRWCPLCQAAAVLRGERPEVSAALADVLTATAAALRSFAGEAGSAGAAPADGAPADGAPPDAGRPTPAVQHIELS